MTTKTNPAPVQTASEARALADRLEAEERDITARRRTARKAAEFDAAMAEFAYADADLTDAYNAAERTWQKATTADPLDITELFTAYVAMRTASRERAQTIGAANAHANGLQPRYGDGGGQVDYRRDWTDIFTDASFATALDNVVKARVDGRGHDALHATNARITDAGAQAEAEIH